MVTPALSSSPTEDTEDEPDAMLKPAAGRAKRGSLKRKAIQEVFPVKSGKWAHAPTMTWSISNVMLALQAHKWGAWVAGIIVAVSVSSPVMCTAWCHVGVTPQFTSCSYVISRNICWLTEGIMRPWRTAGGPGRGG